jgi:hypothetical protein
MRRCLVPSWNGEGGWGAGDPELSAPSFPCGGEDGDAEYAAEDVRECGN